MGLILWLFNIFKLSVLKINKSWKAVRVGGPGSCVYFLKLNKSLEIEI